MGVDVPNKTISKLTRFYENLITKKGFNLDQLLELISKYRDYERKKRIPIAIIVLFIPILYGFYEFSW